MAITTNSLISRQTVGSAGAASITFSNIPQTFTDLKIVVSARSVRSAVNDVLYMTVNGSTTTYSSRVLEGNGAAVSSYSGGSTAFSDILGIPAASSTASVFSNAEIYIPNYTSANYKSISANSVGENNATTAYTDLYAGLWSNTTAITSINLYNIISNFTEYSTFSLYGISSSTTTQNTSVPSATGGDVITTDGTYWYHAFLYSGTFTPLKALTADCLVVAGGGGGGRRWDSSEPGGGGGGAGGYRTSIGGSALSLTAQAYTCTVGAGGVGGNTGNPGNGFKGSDSVFSSITSTGGGYGGGYLNAGGTGGSAGGHGRDKTTAITAGNQGGYSPVEGYAGGRAQQGGNGTGCGGGGGAGAAGNDGTSSVAGTGGIGTYNALTNALTIGQLSSGNYYVAGGGGGTYASGSGNGTGGAGGVGGGGSGATNYNGTAGAGTANTGGGGGGGGGDAGTSYTGGSGGSGIVIVRYAVA